MNQANIVAYVNGEIVPASEAKISIFDRGFILADAAYDTERTFNGKIFKLEEHIDRLFDTCRYLDLDPGLTEQDLIEITTDVVEKNVPLLGPNEDYWVSQRLTRASTGQASRTGRRSSSSALLFRWRRALPTIATVFRL